MPADSIFVAVAVIAMFVVFAAALIWGDLQTRTSQLSRQSETKRRPF